MAQYKIVDAVKLDADLTSVADAIRAKSGKVDTLSFPEGFKTVIESEIPSKAEYEKYLSFFKGQLNSISPQDVPTRIRDYMFASQTRLTYFDFSKTISIGEGAFINCTRLNFDKLPESESDMQLQAYTFRNCYNLALSKLPKNITFIGTKCFQNCFKLAITEIPAGVNIQPYAFSWCESLTTITFNGKPNGFADDAFYQCNNLTTINVPWAEGEVLAAPWGAVNATINYNYTGG